MSFTTNIVRSSMDNCATETNNVFQLQVDIKVSEKGKVSPLYATFELLGKAQSDEDSLSLLADLSTMTWKMPKGDKTAARIFRIPTMQGNRAVVLLCMFSRYSLPTILSSNPAQVKEIVALVSKGWNADQFENVKTGMRKYFPDDTQWKSERTLALEAAFAAANA